MDMKNEILSVISTVASQADADRLARGLVEARLAACVQVESGLVSHYRWQGALAAEPEWRLTAKTIPARLAALREWLAAHHPYEVPQLTWVPMQAEPAYAAWVVSELSVP